MYRVDVTPVVGLPQFGGWSQVVSNNFSSHQLVCAFCVAGDHAGNAGRDLATQISQATARTSQDLQQLIDSSTKLASELDVKIELAIGIFSSNKIILGTLGGSVFLKRDERTGVLLSSVSQIKIIEGGRKAGDIVVLVTHQATDFIDEIKQKFSSGFDTDSVVTSIIPGLHGLNDSSLSSIAFVAGGRELDQVEEVEPVKEKPEIETKPKVEVMSAQDSLLDIPPALKLRGAGKKRSISTAFTDENLDVDDSALSRLGQADPVQVQTSFITKIKQGLGLVMNKIVVWIKGVNWRFFLVSLIGFLSRLKALIIAGAKFVVTVFRRVTARDVYLKTSSPRKLIRTVLFILVPVIIIGSLIGLRVYKVKQQTKNAAAILLPVTSQLDLAKGQLESSPVLARESVNQAITQLEQLEKDFVDQKKAQQLVTAQLVLARELYDQISGQEEFGQLEIFYDLRLIDSEFVTTAVDATSQEVVFLDSGKKEIILLNLENKQVKKIDLSNAGNLTDLELTDSTVTVLGEGILAADLKADTVEENSSFQEIIAQGDSNRNATLIEGFASYIYLLNPEKRNIYRYAKQEDGYSDPIGWVSGAAGFDYNQVSSWAIDGELWVTTRDGGLHKLTSGREQAFEIFGLAEPFAHTLQVFTHEDLKNLYILEADGKRLVVLSKQGEFLKEIKSDSLSSTTALFVSEELGKAFAVSGSIVYAMSI